MENPRFPDFSPRASLPRLARILRRTIEDASHSWDKEQFIEHAIREIGEGLGAKAVTLRPVMGDFLGVGYQWGYKDPSAREHPIEIDDRLAPMLRGRQPMVICDLQRDPELPEPRRERAIREGFHGYISLPMVAFGRIEGILTLYFPRPVDFMPDELFEAQVISDCLALGIQLCDARSSSEPRDQQCCEANVQSKIILIVDDQPAIRKLFRTALATEKFKAILDMPSPQAINFIKENQVDLLVTDCRMPGIGGFELARETKKRWPHAKVLMITASSQDISHEMFDSEKIDLCLPKPCSIHSLFQAVSSLLKG